MTYFKKENVFLIIHRPTGSFKYTLATAFEKFKLKFLDSVIWPLS